MNNYCWETGVYIGHRGGKKRCVMCKVPEAFENSGRGGGIWTHDLLNPIQAR